MTAAAKPALATAVVTKAELIELREAEEDYSKFSKKASDAEKTVKALRLQLAEKVLGVRSESELRALPLEKVEKLYAKRLTDGLWELGKGAPVFAFDLTKAARYTAWKELYIEEKGEAHAIQKTNDTDVTYSYRIEVAQPL